MSKVFLQTTTMEPETLGPSDFSFSIMKIAVAQICQSTGFRAAQSSALETLTRVATIYLQTLAKSASANAANSGRTQSNIFDVVHALQHLSSDQGFAGASDHNVAHLTTTYRQTLPKSASTIFNYDYDCVHALKQLSPDQGSASNPNTCLLASTPLIDVVEFVHSRREIPFAKPLPRRNNSSQNSPLPPQKPRNPNRSSHIPTWLPGFPDSSTYTEPQIKSTSGPNRSAETEHIGKAKKEQKWKSGNTELPKKRERVRFRMGETIGLRVGMKNGVCRGGKRVSWQNHMT